MVVKAISAANQDAFLGGKIVHGGDYDEAREANININYDDFVGI